ncbi:MAG: SHOCT domain-containing protein [Ruminococcaceae bacterium]|nr:SHOCT domain-containing protein [Oscillospiraceae bacterium]
MLKNAEKIYSVINKLLIERQQNKQKEVYVPVTQPSSQTSAADELKKYKDLLDAGIITQEEFDAKKKQLLGL